jgi:hypothetical protein
VKADLRHARLNERKNSSFRLAPDDGARALYSRKRTLQLLAAVLASLLIVSSARAVELFRYRNNAGDGRKFECVFESDEQTVPKTVGKEKAAETAMDWMRVCYGIRVGAMESQEFRTRPFTHLLFAVVLPNGKVVEPKFAERL